MVRYIVVGGNPFQTYTGTTTFTGLYSLGVFNTQKEAEECCVEKYDDCSGLVSWFEVSCQLPLDPKDLAACPAKDKGN